MFPNHIAAFKDSARGRNSNRKVLWWYDLQQNHLTEMMIKDLIGTYDIRIDGDTRYVFLTDDQMQYMCLTYGNVAPPATSSNPSPYWPFTKTAMSEQIAGICYGTDAFHGSEVAVATENSHGDLILNTSKTYIPYVAGSNEGYRPTMGGDHMYLTFKTVNPVVDEKISFKTDENGIPVEFPHQQFKMGQPMAGTYYPCIIICSIPPFMEPKQTRSMKRNVIVEIPVKPDVWGDITYATGRGIPKFVSKKIIRPYRYLGRIGILETKPRNNPFTMESLQYEYVMNPAKQGVHYKVDFVKGVVRQPVFPLPQPAANSLTINAQIPTDTTIGQQMSIDQSTNNKRVPTSTEKGETKRVKSHG